MTIFGFCGVPSSPNVQCEYAVWLSYIPVCEYCHCLCVFYSADFLPVEFEVAVKFFMSD